MGGTHLRCVSWTAVSSEPQSERESLHDQRRLNHEFIKNIGRHYYGYTAEVVADLQVVGSRSIVDVADAATAYPDAYGELLRLLKAGEIDAVVCRSRDRLGREDSLIVTVERLCWRHNAIVIPRQSLPSTLDLHATRDSEGAGLIAAVEAHFARSTVRRLSNERDMGMAARIKAGKFAARIPFGYRRVYNPDGETRIEIDAEAAAILRFLLLDLYLAQGLGGYTIARALNERGMRSPGGGPWQPSAVWEITASLDRYAGVVYLNRRSPKGKAYVEGAATHAPILSQAEHRALKEEFERRAKTKPPIPTVLDGVVMCAETGRPMSHFYARGFINFQCYHCRRLGRSRHEISERRVLAAIRKVIERLEAEADPVALLAARHQPEIERLRGELGELQRGLERSKTRHSRILHAYIYSNSMPEGEFDARMQEAGAEVERQQAAIAEVQGRLAELSDARASAEKVLAIKTAGSRTMGRIESDPDAVHEFLLRTFRVYIRADERRSDTGARNKIDRIEIL